MSPPLSLDQVERLIPFDEPDSPRRLIVKSCGDYQVG